MKWLQSNMLYLVLFGFNLFNQQSVFIQFLSSCPTFVSFCWSIFLVTRGRRSSTIRISSQELPGLFSLTGRRLTLICKCTEWSKRPVKTILKWFRLRLQMNQPNKSFHICFHKTLTVSPWPTSSNNVILQESSLENCQSSSPSSE